MPARTDLEHHVTREELGPVYAVISADALLRFEGVTALRSAALTLAPDFNRDEFRCGEVELGRVIEAANMLPMMAPRRWVHLADLDKLRAKEIELLVGYLERPSATTVLCLSGSKIDQRTRPAQLLSKRDALFVLQPPSQRELAAWILRRAKKRGVAIEPDAAALLADVVGAELGALDMTLEQLWLFRGASGAIDEADVEAVVTATRLHSIFELTDAIGSRDIGRARLLLRNALDGGEPGLRVLAMITRQLRQLLAVKAHGGGDLARALGVKPFVADQLAAQAKRYPAPDLRAMLAAAAEADLRLKSTRLSDGAVLDRLLCDVVSFQQATRPA